MKYIAGFIGVGNMGGALLSAAVKTLKKGEIAVFDVNEDIAKKRAEDTGAVYESIADLVKNSKYIFIGVKPNNITHVLNEIKQYLTEDSVIISMAAGVSIDKIVQCVGIRRVIRIMPNTPACVGEGMILYCCTDDVTEDDIGGFLNVMKESGKTDRIDEKLIDAAAALSGCGPAFVYIFIDALADGAVKCGLPRAKALDYAKQTVLGSTKLAIKSDKHLEQLKDEVCSPGGTTIEGVLELEKQGFRHAASCAVSAAYEKTAKLK